MFVVFTLSIGYAALSTTLNISGNAQVNATDWNIYLTNPVVSSGSVSNSVPSITSSVTASFSTTLNIPGDFYEFTIDVVNDGDINALIDGVSKSPTLSPEQAKYINYDVTYSDGSNILSEQTLNAGETKTIKVRVEFRRDIEASDLPTSSETFNLSFTVNYVQSNDSSGGEVTPDVPDIPEVDPITPFATVVSGSGRGFGDEIDIYGEHFYIINVSDNSYDLFAKYNLDAGCDSEVDTYTPIVNPSGKQDPNAIGYGQDPPYHGVVKFSETNYWNGLYDTLPTDVFNSQSNLYQPLQNYKAYIESLCLDVWYIRLPQLAELVGAGCTMIGNPTCTTAPAWVRSTSYWIGEAEDENCLWAVTAYGGFGRFRYDNNPIIGIRPVLYVSRDILE